MINNFYILPTNVGPVRNSIPGIKLGITLQDMWGRLRAADQFGTTYSAFVWRGENTQIRELEHLAKEHFSKFAMKNYYNTCATEVFVGNFESYILEIENIITTEGFDVTYYLEDYSAFNKTLHLHHVANQPNTFKYLNSTNAERLDLPKYVSKRGIPLKMCNIFNSSIFE